MWHRIQGPSFSSSVLPLYLPQGKHEGTDSAAGMAFSLPMEEDENLKEIPSTCIEEKGTKRTWQSPLDSDI